MTPSVTAAALQDAAEGITYESETDAPWKAFAWPTAEGMLTPEAVRKWGLHKSNTPVQEKSVDEFFAPLVAEQDWYGEEEKAGVTRYRSLLDAVKQRLNAPKIFMFGEQKLVVYIVGSAKEGGWAGLMTTAVET
jgi:hypothetical protein